MDAAQHAVVRANERFYQAFRERDLAAMGALWAETDAIACVHPGSAVLRGREAVMASWRALFANPRTPRIHLRQVGVTMLGGHTAIVTCLEGVQGRPATLCATNVYGLQEGAWRLVHHHTSALTVMRQESPKARGLLN